jgi:hypothetical protein
MKTLLTISLSLLLFTVVNGQADKLAENKNIKVMPSSIVLVRVTQSAEKCPDKKGITQVFRVASKTPVDILRYANFRNHWAPAQWLNQKKDDEFVDYVCLASTPFKYFSRAAGSNEVFPKP